MTSKTSKFWLFALPLSLLILAGAYYIKVPSARRFIDAHTSLGRQLFGSFVHDEVVYVTAPHPDRPPDRSSAGGQSVGSGPSGSPGSSQPPAPTPRPEFNLQRLAADPAQWPKKVALKKATNFPAVVGGKAVGSLSVPAGTEANLKGIRDGQLGLEYQGGGAWVPAEDTDLKARVMGQ
jgi:hypothetical protein